MPAQQHCDSFRFRRAAFYNGLKSKVGLAAAKTAAMRINLNIDGCGVVAPPVHSSLRAPHLLANLLAHNLRHGPSGIESESLLLAHTHTQRGMMGPWDNGSWGFQFRDCAVPQYRYVYRLTCLLLYISTNFNLPCCILHSSPACAYTPMYVPITTGIHID